MYQTNVAPYNITDAVTKLILALVVTGIVVAILAGITYLVILWMKSKERYKKSIESTFLEVTLPRDNEIKIDAAEQLFASFTSIKHKNKLLSFWKIPDSIALEIVALPQEIKFYISVPNKLKDMVEKQIHGSYPGAQINEVEEYNIFNEQGSVAFAALAEKGYSYEPIKTFKDLAVDPLSTITSILAKMQQGEAASIQIIITPSDDSWKKSGRSFIAQTKKQEANPETAKYSVDQKELEAIEQKLTKPAFETFIRVVVVSSTKEAADAHLTNIVSAFSQFSSYNSFKKQQLRFYNRGRFMVDFLYRYLPLFGSGSTLTTEELATIFHFPNKSIETPHIKWLNARTAPPPADMPTSGLYIGKSIYRGVTKPIYMQTDDRRRHMYIIGKTGTGKSEFLKDMILQDIKNGKGVCFIDPHDTIDKILPLIPPERAEDVILFDPSDTKRPMALNMLEAYTEEQKHLIVASIIGLMYKLFDPHQTGIIGPRFEHAVRNAMLTVMSDEGSTFVEVMRALTDPTFVQELLPKVQDPIIRRYWTDQIAQTSDFHKSEVLDYIVSKFGRFVTNKMMRNIIGQSKSS